jgi:hypothetical protein
MRISSQENITLIMDILNEVILSNGNVDMVPNIKNFVIERCSYYHKNRLNYKNIKEVNKFIMRDGYNYMQKLSVKNKNPNNLSDLHKKGNDFDLRLKEHQSNFTTLINGNKPKEIDFSDKTQDDEIPVDNMEYIVNQTMADREKELIKITNKYNSDVEVEKWINNDRDGKNVKLTIKDDVQVKDIKNIGSKKQVRFKDDLTDIHNKYENDILDEIKDFIKNQKDNAINAEILNKLDTININQERIIKLLTAKKSNPTASLN